MGWKAQADSRLAIHTALVSAPSSPSSSEGINPQASADALIAYLQMISRVDQDPVLERRLAELRRSYLQLLDPVWGGVFLLVSDDGSEQQLDPHKRLWAQAAALQVFAAAYQATTEQRYLNAVSSVDEYLQQWLAVSDGSYFAGQLTQPENLPAHISVQRYWSLRTEHERRRFGIPGVDRDIPTAANAQLISGYTDAFAATGDANYLRVAIRAAGNLLERRRAPEGWFVDQAAESDPAKPSLETQALMGLALLDLYQTTADAQWLDAARVTAEYVVNQMVGSAGGTGAVAAAEFLHRLSRLGNEVSWLESGRELLRSVSEQPLPREDAVQLARLGCVLETFASGYVELVISGPPDALASRQLHAAALAAYQPGKLVMLDRYGRFPQSADAALRVCTLAGCLPPISDPAQLPAVLSTLELVSEFP